MFPRIFFPPVQICPKVKLLNSPSERIKQAACKHSYLGASFAHTEVKVPFTWLQTAKTTLIWYLLQVAFALGPNGQVWCSMQHKTCLAYTWHSEFAGTNIWQTVFIHLMNLRLSHTLLVPVCHKTKLKTNLPNECSYRNAYCCFHVEMQPCLPIFQIFYYAKT